MISSRRLAGLISLTIAVSGLIAAPDSHAQKRLGFFPASDGLAVSQIPFAELTHLVWAFATISNNKLSVPDTAKLDSVVAVAKSYGTKVVLSLGGGSWPVSSSTLLCGLAKDSLALQAYISSVADFCVAHKLSGVDIDFEGEDIPTDSGFGGIYTDFVNRSYAIMNPLGLSLSTDMYAGDYYAQYFEAEKFQDKCDWINVMSGGANGIWNTVKIATSPASISTVKGQMAYWAGRVPSSKLVLGIVGFTGLSFQGALKPGETHDGVPGPHSVDPQGSVYYKDIIALDSTKYTFVQGDENTGSYVSGMSPKGDSSVKEIIFYDTWDDVAAKARYARTSTFAGVMYWNIGLDLAPANSRALVHAIQYGLTDSMFNTSIRGSNDMSSGKSVTAISVSSGNHLSVVVPLAGAYSVSIFGLNGRRLAHSTFRTSTAGTCQLGSGISLGMGSYMVRVEGAGMIAFSRVVLL